MALFSNNISRLFENNPVNKVGPTGQPLLGGSNITDLATRSLGGLLGREVRGRPEQLTAALSQIDPKAPDAEQQQLTILAQLGSPQQQVMAAQKIKANREKAKERGRTENTEIGISIIQDTILNAEDIYSKDVLDAVGEAQLEYNVSSEQLDQIYDAVKNARGIASSKSVAKAGLSQSEIYIDEEGNKYQITPTFIDGVVGQNVLPMGGSPEYTNQKLTKTGGQFGETSGQASERKGAEAAIVNWNKNEKPKHAEDLAAVQEASKINDQMIAILESGVETGGAARQAYDSLAQLLGFETGAIIDRTVLRISATEQMLKKLKSQVGGNPSDKESALLSELEASLRMGKGANLAVLKRAKEALDIKRNRLSYAIKAKDPQDYYDYVEAGGSYDALWTKRGEAESQAVEVDKSKSGNGLPTPSKKDGRSNAARGKPEESVIDFNSLNRD
mgnify:FL=1